MPGSWRLLPFHRGSPTMHVALSDALVRTASEPTVWWHATNTPTLIVGAAQSTAVSASIPAVRRHAGGTAVLADARVLGLDVFLPRSHDLAGTDVVEAYRWLGELWVGALFGLGVCSRTVSIAEARAAASAEAAAAVRAACFGTLSPYEVVADERKLVGFAQVRRQNGVLLQAGIHLTFDAVALARLLDASEVDALAAELTRRAVGLDELLGSAVTEYDVIAVFAQEFERAGELRLVPGGWSPLELSRAGVDLSALDSNQER